MTDTTNPAAPERVEVTQADREAAAEYLYGYAPKQMEDNISWMLRGGHDHVKTVQAFARHRLAVLANPSGEDPLVREVAALRKALDKKPFDHSEIIAAMLLEHDAGGITMATLREARAALAQRITSGKDGE